LTSYKAVAFTPEYDIVLVFGKIYFIREKEIKEEDDKSFLNENSSLKSENSISTKKSDFYGTFHHK
jgi:hypothetical protein